MSSSSAAPATTKTAYQRPYKSRHQRRDIDRRKHDEANDYKFLMRIAGVIGLLLVLALGFTVKGLADPDNTPEPTEDVR